MEAVRAISTGYHAAGNVARRALGGVLVVNFDRPEVPDANVLLHPVVPTAAVVAEVMRTVGRALAHVDMPAIHVGAAPADPLEARLAVDGWSVELVVDMLLDGPPAGTPGPVDVRPVRSDADWASLRQLWRMDHVEEAGRGQRRRVERAVTDAVVASKRDKQPTLRVWLASVEGTDAAFITSWGEPGVGGQVEDLFTAPSYRRRGLARALLHHAIADIRARTDGPVMISGRVGDTPAQLYGRTGFRPVLVRRIWVDGPAPRPGRGREVSDGGR